jgi:uncharacterized protein (DUF2147 family)
MRTALVLFLLLLGGPADAASAVLGTWLVEDGKAEVTIAPCGANLCGRISRILRRDPKWNGRDVNNPDPQLRTRPVLGLPILTGFKPGKQALTGGRIYDPSSGRTYRSTVRLNPDGSLKVSGCVAFICRSQRWTRAR